MSDPTVNDNAELATADTAAKAAPLEKEAAAPVTSAPNVGEKNAEEAAVANPPAAEVLPAGGEVAAPVPEVDDKAAAEAAKWGRVDEEGNVWLREGENERLVGQFAASGTKEDALGLFIRRFLDLQAQVKLLESRINIISPHEAEKSLQALEKELLEPAVVGDVESLRKTAAQLKERIAARAEVVAAERAAAKEAALARRTAIVEKAEAVAAQDTAHIHWKNSRAELNNLLEEWKGEQRQGARLGKAAEDALWKRFSAARTKFDRQRRHFFAQLEIQRKETVARKEEIIKQAEAIQNSTDWNATSAQYRELLEDWKRAGRSARKEDDRLWERFRAAQQVFFDARNMRNAEMDKEFSENLARKLELLEEAEKLLPVSDIQYAKEQIRLIGEKWDAIGKVPRSDIARTEGRMREIERSIRDAENKKWEMHDPEKEKRSSGMAAQLESLIAELEEQIAEDKQKGDAKMLKEHEEALAARKAWLEAVLEN